MILEAAAAVEFDGRITVGDFEMEETCATFRAGGFGEVEKVRGNSLPAMGGFDEEFIDPGAFAAILQTEIKTDDEVGDRRVAIARDVGKAVNRILQKFRETFSDDGFVERLVPRIVGLHVWHENENRFEVGGNGAMDGDWHGLINDERDKAES